MTTAGCCTRRTGRERDDVVDGEEISRAVQGRGAKLNPKEARIVFWRLANERRWGPGRIAEFTGYSKSHVAAQLADIRAGGRL